MILEHKIDKLIMTPFSNFLMTIFIILLIAKSLIIKFIENNWFFNNNSIRFNSIRIRDITYCKSFKAILDTNWQIGSQTSSQVNKYTDHKYQQITHYKSKQYIYQYCQSKNLEFQILQNESEGISGFILLVGLYDNLLIYDKIYTLQYYLIDQPTTEPDLHLDKIYQKYSQQQKVQHQIDKGSNEYTKIQKYHNETIISQTVLIYNGFYNGFDEQFVTDMIYEYKRLCLTFQTYVQINYTTIGPIIFDRICQSDFIHVSLGTSYMVIIQQNGNNILYESNQLRNAHGHNQYIIRACVVKEYTYFIIGYETDSQIIQFDNDICETINSFQLPKMIYFQLFTIIRQNFNHSLHVVLNILNYLSL